MLLSAGEGQEPCSRSEKGGEREREEGGESIVREQLRDGVRERLERDYKLFVRTQDASELTGRFV